MRFKILGPLEVVDGGRLLDLGRPKQRAVLAVLLLNANRVVPLDRLIDLLWNGEPPARATGALQVYVSGLRSALEPDRPARFRTRYLVTQPPGYLLRVGPDELDSARFEALAAEGRRLLAQGQYAEARQTLVEALSLWRGPALAEFAFEPFAESEVSRLEELRSSAVADRIEADVALGNHADVTTELDALTRERPLEERLWGLHMLALYRSGRQGDALRVFTRARGSLREELGIEPGPALRQLQADILAQAASLDWHPPPEERASPDLLPLAEDPIPIPAPAVRPRGLVGRETELGVLQRALTHALGGEGSLVLVSGEPGIGKTRLVEELVHRAAALGAIVAIGGSHESEGAPSFWPWMQVIRGILHAGDQDAVRRAAAPVAAEIAQICPEVKELVPELEPPPALDPAAARFRLYDSVNSLLVEMACGRPLVLVLEDLHWADVPSLRLAEFVASRIRESGLLVVGTFRDVDPAVGGPLADTLGVLARTPSLQRIALEGLSQAECAVFIARTFGVDPSPTVAATVHARTDGNPFFVGELTRLLASEGALSGELEPHAGVPAGVRDVIRRRLGRLPAQTNELLAVAAVLGRDVDLRLVAAANRTPEETAADLLDASVAVGILVEDQVMPGRYRFSHSLVQETILGDMGLGRQAKLHARAAGALRSTYGSDDAKAVEVAHHLYAATPVVRAEEAYDAALAAAEVSQRRLAYEQAEDLLRKALDLVTRIPDRSERIPREVEVQHRLATLLSVTEGYHSVRVAEAWSRARELCRELGETPELLVSLSGLARLNRTRGQFEVSVRFSEQLLDLARNAPTGSFAIAGHESLGLTSLFMGDLTGAAAHLAEAIALTDEPVLDGDASPVLLSGIVCRGYLACVRWLLGDDAEADRLSDQAVGMGEAAGHPLTQAVATLYAAKLATMRGDLDGAMARIDPVRRLAASGPLGALEQVADVLEGWAVARHRDPDGCRLLVRGVSQLRSSGWRLALTYFAALHAEACWANGDLDRALAAVEQGLVEADTMGERYYEPELYRLRGELIGARSPANADVAEGWLRRAVTAAERLGAVAFQRRAEAALQRLLG